MKKNVALVLSGGGARGMAHIGVIEALEERGYTIRSVAGTSMGALVGGVYAAGKLPQLKAWLYALDATEVLKLVDFTLSRHGFIKADRVFSNLKSLIPDTDIEALPIPYSATAYDLGKEEEVVFTRGSLYDAIRASVAIPSVLTPVKKGSSVLVDGGVVNNLPLNNVVRTEGDLLVAVHVNANVPVLHLPKAEKQTDTASSFKSIQAYLGKLFSSEPSKRSDDLGYFEFLEKNFDAMQERMVQLVVQQHPPDVLIEVSKKTCGTFDFYKAEAVVEAGRMAARKALDTLE
jgi:NTE family protein